MGSRNKDIFEEEGIAVYRKGKFKKFYFHSLEFHPMEETTQDWGNKEKNPRKR